VDNDEGGKMKEDTGSAKKKKLRFMKITVFKRFHSFGNHYS